MSLPLEREEREGAMNKGKKKKKIRRRKGGGEGRSLDCGARQTWVGIPAEPRNKICDFEGVT